MPAVWLSEPLQTYPALHADTACEVCVIGGGIAGIASAHELRRRGHDVLVIEANALAGGQTSRSTAHLVTALDERYFTLEADYGAVISRAAAAQHDRAIRWIREVVHNEQIDCDLATRKSLLVIDPSNASRSDDLIAREFDAASRAGVECHPVASECAMATGFCKSALLFPDQAQLDPVRLVNGLAKGVVRRGGRICCDTFASTITPKDDRVSVVVKAGHTINAKHVILATHRPPDPIPTLLRPLTPTLSFVVAFDAPPGLDVRDELLLWDGYWDNSVPYHYARVAKAPHQPLHQLGQENPYWQDSESAPSRRWFIVGGEDREPHNMGDPIDRFDSIVRWTRQHLPHAGERRAQWYGTVMEPTGEFAIIDRVPTLEHVYVLAGDSGNGVTYAAIAARRLADMIEGLPTDPIQDHMFAATPTPTTRQTT